MCPRWPSKAKPPRLKDAESSFETGRVLPSPPAPCLPQLPQAPGKGAAEGRAKQRWARGRSWCCIIAWQPRGWSLKSKTEGRGRKDPPLSRGRAAASQVSCKAASLPA